MKISQLFPSKYVKAQDLNGKTVTLTMAKLVIEELGHGAEKERKPVLYFQKATKGMILNATNARTIAALHGDDSIEWEGKRISIYPTTVRAFGKVNDVIRVVEQIPPAPKPAATQAATQVEENEIDDQEDFTDSDDSEPSTRDVDPATGEIIDPDALFTPDKPTETPPHQRLFGQLSSGFGPDAEAVRPLIIEKWTVDFTPDNIRKSAALLSDTEKDLLADHIRENLASLQRTWRNYKASLQQATTSAAKVARPVTNGKYPVAA